MMWTIDDPAFMSVLTTLAADPLARMTMPLLVVSVKVSVDPSRRVGRLTILAGVDLIALVAAAAGRTAADTT